MRTPRIPQSSSTAKESTLLLLLLLLSCLLSILTTEVLSASHQITAPPPNTALPLSPHTPDHMANDDGGIGTATVAAAVAAAAAQTLPYAAYVGAAGGNSNGNGNGGGESCPNRPFADAKKDAIRYPMCLRQPGWNAIMRATPYRVVVAADDGGGRREADNITEDNVNDDSIECRRDDDDQDGTVHNTTTITNDTGPSPTVSLKKTVTEIHTSSTSTLQSCSSIMPEEPDDHDSPLDNSNFLSFEEWREQNLAKIGQSTDNVARKKDSRQRPPPSIRNNLESIGDEGEIDLDFAGFVAEINPAAGAGAGAAAAAAAAAAASSPHWDRTSHRTSGSNHFTNYDSSHQAHSIGHQDDLDLDETAAQPGLTRRKKPGVTCKERSNYASFDCAATVLKTNRECTGASAVLVENKDSYMLNECRAQNKFIILELCDDILIDTIVLANFEFFSSRFRTFRVSVSDRYPPKPDNWKDLGIFEALNTREIQAFPVENPLIWARYLKIDFLTHYGSEFYCPLSLIRVHGTTMMEEFKSEGENNRADEIIEDHDVAFSELEPEGITVLDSAVANNDTWKEEQKDISFEQPAAIFEEIEIVLPETADGLKFPPLFQDFEDVCWTRGFEVQKLLLRDGNEAISHICGMGDFPTPTSDDLKDDMKASTVQAIDINVPDSASMQPVNEHNASKGSVSPTAVTATRTILYATSRDKSSQLTNIVSTNSVVMDADDSVPYSETIKTFKTSNQHSLQPTSSSLSSSSSSSSSSSPSSSSSSPSSLASPPSPPSPSSSSSSSSVAPASPSPTTQESFFKSMNKRLQMLEMNSTLSLLYIGEQSRILREAFNKVEKRQLSKTTAFLENLNHTVLTELHDFRQQYDQVWQSVIMEFEQQRLQYNREVFAVTRQLGVLADEILFQKRLSLVQSIFVLILFGIVVFSRDTVRRYLELPPRVQGMLGRGGRGSPGLRTSWQRYPFSFPLRSPSQSPMSVPASPVPDGVAREQTSATECAMNKRLDIHHRRASPSMDSQNSDDIIVSGSDEIYPVADRPPPSSSSSSPPSVSSLPTSSSPSPPAKSSVQGEPGPGLEDETDQGRVVSDERSIDVTTNLPTKFQSRRTGSCVYGLASSG